MFMNNNLNRFLKAQATDYPLALREIQNGYKSSHWIWYIFPQVKGLGYSGMCQMYGIVSRQEAEAYLAEPTLNARLREITQALLAHKDKSAEQILGYTDADVDRPFCEGEYFDLFDYDNPYNRRIR
jgi:uncharacterized protein (DUF1810 family)